MQMSKFKDYRPSVEASAAALAEVQSDLDAARTAMAKAASDDEQRKMTAASEKTWTTYRDAEQVLYVVAFGGKFDTDVVRNDIGITLARARSIMLRAEARGLPRYR